MGDEPLQEVRIYVLEVLTKHPSNVPLSHRV